MEIELTRLIYDVNSKTVSNLVYYPLIRSYRIGKVNSNRGENTSLK